MRQAPFKCFHVLTTAALLFSFNIASAQQAEVHQAETAKGAATGAEPSQALYQANCGACHQANSQGLTGAFPQLAGNENVVHNPAYVMENVLKGKQGELVVGGTTYNGVLRETAIDAMARFLPHESPAPEFGLPEMMAIWNVIVPVDERPTKVAEIKIGLEAHSVESSKYKGYEDDFAIAGAYWPPQFVLMDGLTQEPRKIVSTRGMTVDTQEYNPEPRVAAIVFFHEHPEIIVNVKETGKILLVDYSDIENLQVTTSGAARFLHDGGWDRTNRYFMTAANESDRIAVVDGLRRVSTRDAEPNCRLSNALRQWKQVATDWRTSVQRAR